MVNKARIYSGTFPWYFVLVCVYILAISAAPETKEGIDKINQERTEQKLKKELEELANELSVYEGIIQNFLKPINETVHLEKIITHLHNTSTVTHQQIIELQSKLSTDKKNVTAKLDRQENELVTLESKTINLQKQWQDQQSEFLQLKNKWSELSKKAGSSAQEAQTLRESSQETNQKLEEQKKKVKDQERAVESLNSILQDAELSILDLKNDVGDIFNKQGHLETLLEGLRAELDNVRRVKVGTAPEQSSSQADTLCRRLGLA